MGDERLLGEGGEVTEMRFLPTLREFLRSNRRIYTVRKYSMTSGDVRVEGVGICRRTSLGGVVMFYELTQYVPESGFSTLVEWANMIRRFVPQGSPMYLYRVDLVSEL